MKIRDSIIEDLLKLHMLLADLNHETLGEKDGHRKLKSKLQEADRLTRLLYKDIKRVFWTQDRLAVDKLVAVDEARRARARARDAEAAKRFAEELDSLTNLYNAKAFQIKLAEALSALERRHDAGGFSALWFMDARKLKSINDEFGHQIGTAVLVGIGTLIDECFRSDGNDLCARYGGDEFCVFIRDLTSYEGIVSITERFRAAVSRYPWRKLAKVSPDSTLHVQVNTGVVYWPKPTERLLSTDADFCASEILHMADQLMYGSKAQEEANAVYGGTTLHLVLSTREEVVAT